MQHHNYSLDEIDRLIPWEKEVYLTMLQEWIKEYQHKADSIENYLDGARK